MNVGATIKAIRESLGMAQVRLAEQVGVSQAMICQIERGTKAPSLQLSVEIAAALGCEIQDLIK